MSSRVRTLQHPGPVTDERIQVSPCRVRRIDVSLEPGISLNDSVAWSLQKLGVNSAYVRLDGVVIERLRYVVPAEPCDGDHAAWYSETYAPSDVAVTLAAGLFLGRRDGGPFTHCHGLWRTPNSDVRMGHLLTTESTIAAEAQVPAWVITGALPDVKDDKETNFRLFSPQPQTLLHEDRGSRGLLCTIRPNVDLASSIASLCQLRGFSKATLHGIGSLVGGKLRGSPDVASFVTEVLILDGHVTGQLSSLNVAAVGTDGHFSSGTLEGVNMVGVTFELLIEEAQ